MPTPKIESPSREQQAWIECQLTAAAELVAACAPGAECGGITLGDLDRALAALAADGPRDAAEIARTVDAAAAAFGELLVKHLGMRWVAVRGERESELALHALPGAGDVLIYPQSLVARGCERGEPAFLRATYQQIAAHLKSLRR